LEIHGKERKFRTRQGKEILDMARKGMESQGISVGHGIGLALVIGPDHGHGIGLGLGQGLGLYLSFPFLSLT
jgi:hypothetical protein